MTATLDPTEVFVLPGSSTPCQARLDEKRAWSTTLAVRTGGVVVGVRADTEESVATLEALLAPLRAPEYDDRVAPNFSVEVGREDRARRLFLAYQAHQVVARRYDGDELLSDLVHLLDDLARAKATDLLAVHSGVLVEPSGQAMLLPVEVHRTLLTRRRQLEAVGARLLAARTQRYDAMTGEVVTGSFDSGAARALDGLPADDVLPDRIPVGTWCVGVQGEAPMTIAGADAVIACIGTVLNREQVGMGPTLRGLRAAVLRHRVVAMPTLTAGAQAAAVLDLLA